MTKSLYIAEKPSVAQEFAKALKQNMQRRDGYLESDQSVVTWCVGHLVTMSYPEKSQIKELKREVVKDCVRVFMDGCYVRDNRLGIDWRVVGSFN